MSSISDSATRTSPRRTSPCGSSPRQRRSRPTTATRCRVGLPKLREAIAGYYRRTWDVELDVETEITNTIGSKEGFSHLMWVLLDRGDAAIVPSPSYPIHIYGPLFAGADLRQVPMRSLANPDERGSFAEEFFDRLTTAYDIGWPKPARAGHLLPPQPDRRLRRARLHAAGRRLLPRTRDDRRPRLRLCRRRVRRVPAAEHPPGRGRQGVRSRAVLDDEELLDGGLASRLPARQRRGRAGARQAQELPRLRHVPAGADRRHGHDQRGGGVPGRGVRDVRVAARRARRRPRADRMARPQAGWVDVRVGTDSRSRTPSSTPSSSPRCSCATPTSRSRRASASVPAAKASSASP